jgi:hypothetical protein
MTTKSWADYERERLAVQRYSPKFSRAELCRRAGIDTGTFAKGLKNGSPPRQFTGGPVGRAIAAEIERLPQSSRDQLELVIAAERAMVAAGLREGE